MTSTANFTRIECRLSKFLTARDKITPTEMDKAVEKPVGRPMKFPYTFSAKIAQFPFKYYVKNQWVWKYYLIALVVASPVFYKISKLANSPENKANFAAAKKKEAEAHH